MVGTCRGCHSIALERSHSSWHGITEGFCLPISMTGYVDDLGAKGSVESSTGRSLKLDLALYASIPIVVRNHQYMGFLLLPRGPVMTASIPQRGSSLRVIRILLPTNFFSRSWYSSSSVSRSVLSLSCRRELSLLISLMSSSADMSRGAFFFVVRVAFFGDDMSFEPWKSVFKGTGACLRWSSDQAWSARRPGQSHLCRRSNCIVLM